MQWRQRLTTRSCHRRRLMAAGLLLIAGLAHAEAADTRDPAALYRAAVAYLEAGRADRFQALASRLDDSPLRPYLEYARLRESIETVAPSAVEDFLLHNPALPVADALRTAWLRELARRKDWPRFLTLYDGGGDVYVRCHLVQARLDSGQEKAAVEAARELWLVGYRQPEACIPAFELLERTGELTSALVRQRIRLALMSGHDSLAETLAERLPEDERQVVSHWLAVYHDPAASLELEPEALGPPEVAATMISAAMGRLARQDPALAHALWPEIEARHPMPDALAGSVARTIALYAVYSRVPDGTAWLWALPAAYATETVHAWRVRGALRTGDWRKVLRGVNSMPDSQGAHPTWQYWKARALEELGRAEAARPVYRTIAGQFSYYGFLAADALGTPYYWGDAIKPPAAERQQALRDRLAVQRALLLHRAEAHDYAYLEWRAAVHGLDDRDRLAAARVALKADWPWAAMYASALAGVENASFLRFPRGFLDAVGRGAEAAGQPRPWLLAMIRQESAFRLNACSHVGACGLMQLMPGTAEWMLERGGKDVEAAMAMLNDPAINIATGAAYLDYLHGRFEHYIPAVAAYNAGPGNVSEWLERSEPPPGTPRWVETLPFGETREYLQAVLFNQVVYRLRLEGRTNRLSEIFSAPRDRKVAAR